MCCGAAGLYSLGHPQTSGDLGARKAAEIDAIGVRTVVTANPGCEMQLRGATGSRVRLAHPVEIYAESIGLTKPIR